LSNDTLFLKYLVQ